MSIKLLPEEERPVEKALHKGLSTLSNGELLALILRTGTSSQTAMGLAESILMSVVVMPSGLRPYQFFALR